MALPQALQLQAALPLGAERHLSAEVSFLCEANGVCPHGPWALDVCQLSREFSTDIGKRSEDPTQSLLT